MRRGWGPIVLAIIASLFTYWFSFERWYITSHSVHRIHFGRPTAFDSVLQRLYEPANQFWLYQFRRDWKHRFRNLAGEYRILENGGTLTLRYRSPNRLELSIRQAGSEAPPNLPKFVEIRFGDGSVDFFDPMTAGAGPLVDQSHRLSNRDGISVTSRYIMKRG